VEDHRNILQIIGSVLMVVFGIYTFLSKPSENYRTQGSGKMSTYSQDAVTAILVTLSNPLIIFIYIALFAQFNFIAPDETFLSIIAGLLCITLGAIFWWFLITTIVGKLRSIFNLRGLWIMNKILGIIIIASAILVIIYSLEGDTPF
jgi:threonine/homoserine/homoserine lactone efflux protein